MKSNEKEKTVIEFSDHMQKVLDAFKKHWSEESEKNKKEYPEKMHMEDWCEQFDFFYTYGGL